MIMGWGPNRLFSHLRRKLAAQTPLLFFTDTLDSSNDAQRILSCAKCDTRDPGRDAN